MGTTLWYIKILEADQPNRQFRIWICRWYSDCTLPQSYSFFAMILHEMFEDWGPRFDLEISGFIKTPDPLPEDLASDYNPPNDPNKYIEDVRMVRYCGINESVSYELDVDEIQRITNELQAEYVVKVTDEKYLSSRSEPCRWTGNFVLGSTAYDSPKDETNVEIGEHEETIICPRSNFLVNTATARSFAKNHLQTLGQQVEALQEISKIRSSSFSPSLMTRDIYVGATYGAITEDRDVLDFRLDNESAMKYGAACKLFDQISCSSEEMLEKLGDDKNNDNIHDFKKLIVSAGQAVEVLGELPITGGNPMAWILKGLEEASGKDADEFIRLMNAAAQERFSG